MVQDEYGSTALEIACHKGHTKIAEMLLKKGAMMDYRNKVTNLVL